jgi:signal transduction histidine kinase
MLTLTIKSALQQQEQEKQKTLSHLIGVGKKILSSLDPQVLLPRLCQLTTKILRCDYSATFLWQQEHDAYIHVSGYGDTADQLERACSSKISRVGVRKLLAQLERDEVVQVATGQQPLIMQSLLRPDMGVCLYVALRRHDGKIVGLHTAGYQQRGRSFTFQQQRLALWLTQITSLALENACLASQLADANHMKEEFLSTLSHELRTPLHIIMGYNDLLLDQTFGPLMDEQMRVLQQMAKSSEALFDLISTMLDMSRLQSGQLPLELTQVRFSKFFREFRAEIQNLWEKPNLNFRWSIAPNLPLVCTDPSKLKVIIKNLISNAVKFTDSGSIDVNVYPSRDGVEITVADTGIGIAPEVFPSLFEPFRQGDGSTTRRYEGVGLGLYVVKRLLELLGGAITVESQLGSGTLIHVWLPTVYKAEPRSTSFLLNGH